MDDDLAEVHAEALAACRATVAGIGEDQWDRPTPCTEWNVRELVGHVVAGNWWAAELGAGHTIADVGDRLDGDVLGNDPLGAYDASAAAAGDVFRAPGAMDRPCAVSYGPVPGSVYCGHRLIDVLIHGWDVAAATTQSTRLDPRLVAVCLDVVRPQAGLLAASGAFATDVSGTIGAGTAGTGDADADAQAELLALLGRRG